MNKFTWRIYYDDGTTFDNTMGEPEHAPSFGIIAIVAYDEVHERMVLQKWNYYWCKDLDGRPIWYGSDQIGLIDQLAHDANREVHGLKLGRTIANKLFQDIIIIAANDPDLTKTTREVFISQPRELK